MRRHINRIGLSSRLTGIAVTVALLCVLPAAALGVQYHRLNSGTVLRLDMQSVTVHDTAWVPHIEITTPLNYISTSRMTGENSFVAQDDVYVFMSFGPNDIWYPYAISKRPPDPGCGGTSCLVLKGRVTDIARDTLRIAYGFETVMNSSLMPYASNAGRGEVEIQVDASGNTFLKTVRIGKTALDQRHLFMWNPPGSTSFGAKMAPATNPPK